ncbi:MULTISPECIES: zf-TFIIB domain-containing protein [unclassified Corallococcus]|uniref:zf-TFIIB domain-containing protein n=1 Tax=unclassified Corallococcus TaxID=2685029 RepID=UPI001A8C0C44|nr:MULTISPECIES: zf-TFIIB domain-containing protein [unclassified Corallococcus]MBN9686742.1 zf-TFIIB domain-containing protein [Corallococcus sp. NCSPR001]WAS81842.1 zf-TFIIB domain-containing protein [Corallococcus sp. NCRR]
MNCPGCNADVEMTDLEGDHDETLRKCGECGGLWIDVSDLRRILLHNNLPGLEQLGGKVDGEALTGQCPDCQVDFVRIDGGDRNHPLHYDTCESCGGIFLESEFADATDAKAAEQEIISFFRNFDAKRKAKAAI